VNAGTILDTLCENFACFVAFLLCFFLCKFSEMITVLPCTFVIIMPILCKIEAVEMETKKIFFLKKCRNFNCHIFCVENYSAL